MAGREGTVPGRELTLTGGGRLVLGAKRIVGRRRDGRGTAQAISDPVKGVCGTTNHLCRATKQISGVAEDHVRVEIVVIHEVRTGLRQGNVCFRQTYDNMPSKPQEI